MHDLGVARVYFSLLDPAADPAPVADGLERASGFLRAKLGQALKVRHVPELRFEHDDSAAEGQRISDLIERFRGLGLRTVIVGFETFIPEELEQIVVRSAGLLEAASTASPMSASHVSTPSISLAMRESLRLTTVPETSTDGAISRISAVATSTRAGGNAKPSSCAWAEPTSTSTAETKFMVRITG